MSYHDVVEYKVKRNKRSKHIRIKIKGDGSIVVTAPPRASEKDIQLAILESGDWINQTLQKLPIDETTRHEYVSGETFLFAGREYPLHIIEEDRTRINLSTDDESFIAKIPRTISDSERKDKLKKKFIDFYKKRGLDIVKPQIEKLTNALGISYKNISINSAQSRWGSCSTKGNINFSWKLFLAPPEIIEYVVIHEVCHLVHHNHGKEFWELVHSFDSDYKNHRKWLQTRGHTLSLR